MAGALEKWLHVPVYLASHSAHVDPAWKDGAVVSDEYRILYAGKLYAGSPGLTMLLELIQQLVKAGTDKPVRAVFYVDDTDKLRQLAEQYGITDHVSINGWVSPGDLWKEIRSAHLLITFDTGLTMPLIMTKTIQYAHSGRQILALYIHHSPPYETFFEENKSGYIYYTVPLAVSRVQELIKNKEQYEVMPPLRKVPTRDEIARTYGHKIEELMGAGKERK
jgi:glycosyltransferase involved in cell wall biosynthesis